MPWVSVPDPSKEVLDQLYAQAVEQSARSCPDCGVAVGTAHKEGCDVARCLTCGGQRLGCNCMNGAGDIWTGLWPGTRECYEKGFVCRWEGPSIAPGWEDGSLHFDYNREARSRQ